MNIQGDLCSYIDETSPVGILEDPEESSPNAGAGGGRSGMEERRWVGRMNALFSHSQRPGHGKMEITFRHGFHFSRSCVLIPQPRGMVLAPILRSLGGVASGVLNFYM